MFSCEICEIYKNIFFIEYLWWLLLPVSDIVTQKGTASTLFFFYKNQ